MKHLTLFLLAFIILISCGSRETGEQVTEQPEATEVVLFMQSLAQFCGERLSGEAMILNKDLIKQEKIVAFHFEKCTDNEIRIAVETKESEKTTIILTLVAGELLLKHDVKSHNMAPAEFTMYGGFADDSGNKNKQLFPVHNFGGTMWPGFENYAWEMGFDNEDNSLYYKEINNDLVVRHYTLSMPEL